MMTVDEQVQKLRSEWPIGELEARVRIANSYRNLCRKYRWSFLIGEDLIATEAPYNTGTVAIGPLATAIVLTGGVWSAAWVNRRIRIGSRQEPYDITITGTTTGTLSKPWAGGNETAATYEIYRDKYPLTEDCDYGKALIMIDAGRRIPFPLVSAFDLKLASSGVLGETGLPLGAAQVELQMTGSNDPVVMLQFLPAPDAIYSYPVIFTRKAPALVAGAKPLWPEDWENLIWQNAVIEWAEENPRRFVSPDFRSTFGFALMGCRKRNDGGAEIERRMQGYLGNLTPFTNVHVIARESW